MWTGNDFLPAFKGVGWTKANKLHSEYERLPDHDSRVFVLVFLSVYLSACHLVCLPLLLVACLPAYLPVCLADQQRKFLLSVAKTHQLKEWVVTDQPLPEERFNLPGDADPYGEGGGDGATVESGVPEVAHELECRRHTDMMMYAQHIKGDWCRRDPRTTTTGVAADVDEDQMDQEDLEEEGDDQIRVCGGWVGLGFSSIDKLTYATLITAPATRAYAGGCATKEEIQPRCLSRHCGVHRRV